jgi:hypothetical protein
VLHEPEYGAAARRIAAEIADMPSLEDAVQRLTQRP